MKVKNELHILTVLIYVILISGIILCTPLFAAEPKPGDVINASNIEQYKDYFPEFLARFIRDGAGFIDPLVINVREAEEYFPTKAFVCASQKNKDKFSIDNEGNIAGDWKSGTPFPDPTEPNMAEKLMWNNYYRWRGDDFHYQPSGWVQVKKRKGGSCSSNGMSNFYLYFQNRTAVEPIPDLPNQNKLFMVFTLNTISGPSKDLNFLVWRYADPAKADDMWAYVPTLRRSIRMMSSERSNPVQNMATTWDDFYCFDGKIHEFRYKYLGKFKNLVLTHHKTMANGEYFNGFPGPIACLDPWELWNTYKIEITAKNSRYPESKRILSIIDNIYYSHCAEVYDKNGTFWRGLWAGYSYQKTEQGEYGPFMTASSCSDFKTEYWGSQHLRDEPVINSGLTQEMFSPGLFGIGIK